jgi:ubiquinol-cytochrome c reductase cytochrome b subunit
MTLIAAACFGERAMQIESAKSVPAMDKSIVDGATLFHERGCDQCHQIRGVGGHKGPDLSGVGRSLHKPAIERQIVAGGDAMPAFGEVLPPAEIQALVKYLARCKEKIRQPKAAATVPQAPVKPD